MCNQKIPYRLQCLKWKRGRANKLSEQKHGNRIFQIKLKADEIEFWMKEDGTLYQVDPEGEMELVIENSGESIRLKKIGKLP